MEDYEKKTEVIKFRATRAQRYEITRRALDYGFSSVSAFVLWAVLEEDHTEKGAAALTASLEKVHSEAGETLRRIQSDFDARQEVFSAAVSSAVDDAAALVGLSLRGGGGESSSAADAESGGNCHG